MKSTPPLIPLFLACASEVGLGRTEDEEIPDLSSDIPPNVEVCKKLGFTFDFMTENPVDSIWAGFSPVDENGFPLEECLDTIDEKNIEAEAFAEETIYGEVSKADLLDCEVSLTVFVEYEYDPETHYQRITLWVTVGAQNVEGFEESIQPVEEFPLNSFVVDVARICQDGDEEGSCHYFFNQGPMEAYSEGYDALMVNQLVYLYQTSELTDFLWLNPNLPHDDPFLGNDPDYSIYYTPIFAKEYFEQVYDSAILTFAPSSFDPFKPGIQHFVIF